MNWLTQKIDLFQIIIIFNLFLIIILQSNLLQLLYKIYK